MGDEIVTHSVLLLWGGIFAGLVAGGLLGWRAGFQWGLGVGCLLIGVGGLAGAGHLGWHRWQALDGTIATSGVLMEFTSETVKESNGRRRTVRSPIVRFVAEDGTEHRVKGLGGSRANASPGDPVPVRYRPEDPAQALVADAQNLWAGVWGLGMFGIVPLMVGIAAIPRRGAESSSAPGASRPRGKSAVRARKAASRTQQSTQAGAPTAPLSASQQRMLTWSMRGGHLLLLSSFVVGGLFGDHVGHAVAASFTMVAAALVFYGVASGVRNSAWQAGVTTVMAAIVFLLFAVGLWLFT